MDSRAKARALTRLVVASFQQVSKNPTLQNKWIASESWLKILKDSKLGGEVIRKVTTKRFTSILKKEFLLNENNEANNHGIYFMNRRIRRVHSQQNKNITCFFVTKPGELPPATESQWFHYIIDAPQTTPATSSPASSQASTQASLSPATSQASTQASSSPALAQNINEQASTPVLD